MIQLAKFRKNAKLKQKDVADYLNITQGAYSKYEKNRMPDINTLINLTKLFNISLDCLCGIEKQELNTPERQKAIQLVQKLDDLYLSMSTRYMERMLEDQERIESMKLKSKQWY